MYLFKIPAQKIKMFLLNDVLYNLNSVVRSANREILFLFNFEPEFDVHEISL